MAAAAAPARSPPIGAAQQAPDAPKMAAAAARSAPAGAEQQAAEAPPMTMDPPLWLPAGTMDGAISVNQKLEGDTEEQNGSITQIGPWGGPGGTLREIEVDPVCLNSITIRSDESIQSIAFSYSDKSGKQHDIGAWGVQGGRPVAARYDTIQLGPSEFLIQVSGTVGPCNIHSSIVVTSLMFTTNARCYGPFGAVKGTIFHSPLMSNGSIVGFFAKAMGSVDAIGLYVNPHREPMEKEALVTKVGLWGSSKGCPYDVDVLPRRLISVDVYHGKAVYSLAFTYYDCNEQKQSSGSWGGSDTYQDGILDTILLGDAEFLEQISGTIGQCSGFPDLLTSLQFITNTGSYGPFGQGGGNDFCSPMQNDGSIVGFFANADKYVYSIGLYVVTTRAEYNDGSTCGNSNLEDDIKKLDKACITKIGPWGGCKGNSNDIKVSPIHLNSVTIRSGECIHSLAFSYSDNYGKQHHAGPWGACKDFSYGSFETVQLAPSEFLTKVSGTIGFTTKYSSNVITSITFETNADRKYGPFGGGEGLPFHSPVMSNGSIVGFFAQAERVVNSIGFYVNSEREPMQEQDSVIKIGPWGGDSGRPNDVDVLPRRLISVVVHHSTIINSLKFTYIDLDGQEQTVGPWGRMGEPRYVEVDKFDLDRSEFLTEVSGTIGRNSENSDVVKSLLFVTNTRRHIRFGKGGGTSFRSPLQSNGSIVGFFVNAGDVIDAIGVYFSPKREAIKEEEEGGSGISRGMSSKKWVDIESASNDLEDILDGKGEPTNLPLQLLQYITEGFNAEREIGRGGFGIVYKGDLQNRSVAVKRLLNSHTIQDEPFNREATSLISVKHRNIVRFLGYCANTENKAIKDPESGETLKYIFAEIRERLFCFEYINNGSLDKYLTDELRGLEWHTRYQIIRGICDGLFYLHKEKGIVHRDMKPANILLDDLMIPKITDFGISKLLEGATHAVTSNPVGSLVYCAPEIRYRGEVSIQSDIYSLGFIIIELVTGCKDDPEINNVLRRWRHRWNKSVNYPPSGYQQITKCIDIASRCLSDCPKRRPYIWDIVDDMESTNEQTNDADASLVAPISPYAWELLEFDTLELNFPFEINKQIPCSLQLTNVTDGYVAFDIKMTGVLQYCIEPEKGVVPPRSKCNVTVTLQAQKRVPHASTCKYDLFNLRCAAVNEGRTAEDITEDIFDKKSGKEFDEVTLKVVI